jgi:hypothetical protein
MGMRITWCLEKERRNYPQAPNLSLALQVFADPLAETVWDRSVDGEKRWRTLDSGWPVATTAKRRSSLSSACHTPVSPAPS